MNWNRWFDMKRIKKKKITTHAYLVNNRRSILIYYAIERASEEYNNCSNVFVQNIIDSKSSVARFEVDLKTISRFPL